MMNIEFRQEIGRCFLVAECGEIKENEYHISMITENSIRGLLSCKVVYEETKRKLFFDVTNKISLEDKYSGKNMEVEDITELFSNISQIYSEGRKYLLDEKYFVISPEFIFFDPISGDFYLIYLPQESNNEKIDNPYEKIADFFLQKVNQYNQLAVKITYMFYKMTKINTFSMEAFRDIIDKEILLSVNAKQKNDIDSLNQLVADNEEIDYKEEIEDKGINKIIVTVGISLVLIVVFITYKKSMYATYILISVVISVLVTMFLFIKYIVNLIRNKKEEELDFYMKNAQEEDYWCDNETQIFSDETEVFTSNADIYEKELCISWKENGKTKKHSISSYPVTIGKKSSEVDCCISEQSVSRIHAKIEKVNGKMFIKDMNSTNGTLVNGQRISASTIVEIEKESEIYIGNVQIRLI